MGYPFENGERYRDGKPFFSIGVTTYDRVSMLAETLSSILAQTFEDFEVIVGNDNPDRIMSGEVLGINDTRIRFVNYPKNLGELGNMNSMLNMSRGKYFTWIADDDLYTPNFLKVVYTSLVKFNFLPCVFTSYNKFFDDTNCLNMANNIPVRGQVLTGREFLRQYLKGKIKTIGVMGVFDTAYLKSLGGLEDISNDNKGICSEYMLIIRTGLLEKLCYINLPLMFYRSHETSWGVRNTNVEIYKRAGQNLIPLSIEIFKKPALRDDFQQNLFAIFKLSLSYVCGTASKRPDTFRILDMFRYHLSLLQHIQLLQETVLYRKALMSWAKAFLWLIVPTAKIKFKATAPQGLVRMSFRIQSFLRRLS